jgi:hypothetical protein
MIPLRVGQRAREAPQHHGRVVAIRQAVEHAGRALGTAVTGIGDIARERHRAMRRELTRGRFDEQAHLEMPGVVAERNGFAIRLTQAAVSGKDQHLVAAHQRRIPTHAGVLAPAKQVTRGLIQEHFGGEWGANRTVRRNGSECRKVSNLPNRVCSWRSTSVEWLI